MQCLVVGLRHNPARSPPCRASSICEQKVSRNSWVRKNQGPLWFRGSPNGPNPSGSVNLPKPTGFMVGVGECTAKLISQCDPTTQSRWQRSRRESAPLAAPSRALPRPRGLALMTISCLKSQQLQLWRRGQQLLQPARLLRDLPGRPERVGDSSPRALWLTSSFEPSSSL
jgi:hypothetical protein